MVVRQYFQPLCIVLQSDFISIRLDGIIQLWDLRFPSKNQQKKTLLQHGETAL
jgi:hypothetical protein